jgi:putative flavoprotein involved in K+ transport
VSERGASGDYEAIVCGAGAAGLASAAALQQRGVSSLVLERSGQVGSSWRGRYDTLRLNTLGWMSTQPGYHVGRRARHFPSRDEWVDYLERYARHHRLQIELRTEVRRIESGAGGWRIDTSQGARRGRFAVVSTGYDHEPTMPDWAGRDTFSGELIHAAEYRNAAPYLGRDVLVVGANVTGTEVAFFLAEGGAARVRVAMRTPPNILRRCRFGLPLNPTALILEHLPAAFGDRLAALSQRLMFGDLTAYGLPRPPMGVVSTNRERRQGPAIDDGFVGAVKKGRVEIVAAVDGFDGADVVLADGSRIQPDAVVAATGYARGLEALVGHLGVLDTAGHPHHIRGETHPNAPGLYFVGYVTPLYGQLRGIRLEANRVARAVAREKK